MERVIPWSDFVREVAPYYPRAGHQGGRPTYPLEKMVRIYFIQQFHDLSDAGVENKLYEITNLRCFTRVSLAHIPAATTILHFRHLLERHGLQRRFFTIVCSLSGTRITTAARHLSGRHDDKSPALDQEQTATTGCDDEFGDEGFAVVFWNESAGGRG